MTPVGRDGSLGTGGLVVNENVTLDKSLVGRQDETGKPVFSEMLGDPLCTFQHSTERSSRDEEPIQS